jgi:hypothetical protein
MEILISTPNNRIYDDSTIVFNVEVFTVFLLAWPTIALLKWPPIYNTGTLACRGWGQPQVAVSGGLNAPWYGRCGLWNWLRTITTLKAIFWPPMTPASLRSCYLLWIASEFRIITTRPNKVQELKLGEPTPSICDKAVWCRRQKKIHGPPPNLLALALDHNNGYRL